jgi:hypothetical protein
MSAELSIILNAQNNASGAIRQVAGDLGNLDKIGGTVSKGFQGLQGVVGVGLKAAAGIGVAGISALTYAFSDSVDLARTQINAEKQLAQVIKSTGSAAGLTAHEIKAMASELQSVTNFGDEAIIGGQNLLLTFTNIGKDVFPRATEAMLDMSQVFGQDLKSSAIQLGKALNDPVAGITALSRVGVSFTEDQKEMIKAMAEAGDVAGAQGLILAELERQVGGSAKAMRDPVIQLSNAWGDFKEVIGMGVLAVLNPLYEQALPFVTKATDLAAEAMGKFTEGIESGQTVFQAVRDVLVSMLPEDMVAGFLSLEASITGFVSTVQDIASPILEAVGSFVSWKDVLIALGIVVASIVLPALWGIVAAATPIIAVAAGLILGVSLLRNAWESNWGDIQGKTETVMAAITPMFDRLLEYVDLISAGDWSGLVDAVFGDVNTVLEEASAMIAAFEWADWIDGAMEWGTYITAIAWDAFITALAWTSDIVGAVDWGSYITALSDWGAAIGTVAWDSFLTLLDWQLYIWKLEWAAFVSVLTWTSDLIGQIDWTAFITALNEWGAYITEISWDAFITALTWGAEYVSSLDWSAFVTALTDWGTWLTTLDWTSIITTTIDWVTWIPALTWNSFVNLLDWGFIAIFAWADFVGSLDWATFVTGALDWGDRVSDFDWGTWVSGALDWSAYIAAFTWDSYVSKMKWPIIAQFAWSEWISKLEWPTLPTFDWNSWVAAFVWPTLPAFSWSSWIASFNWPTLPVVSWADFIPTFRWPSIPEFPGWGSLMDRAKNAVGLGGDEVTERALGDRFFQGGVALVGEQGPELISMPKGTRIYSNPETEGLLAGAGNGGGVVVNIHANVGDGVDIERMAYRVAEVISRRGR